MTMTSQFPKLVRRSTAELLIRLNQRRYWFADPEPPPAEPPAPEPPPKDKGNPPPTEAKFTQADFDFHLGKRAKEAKQQRDAELLKEFGVEKMDDLKALVKAKKDADDAQK